VHEPSDPCPARRRYDVSARVNVALAVLVLVLGAVFAVLAVRDSDAAAGAPTGSAADRTAAEQDSAARAAATQVQAFLDIDHDDVDAQLDRMLQGTTEDFRRQFARQVRTISAEAERRQSSADVTLRRVGLSSWTEEAATALVAADTDVTSTADGTSERRTVPWRIEVDLVHDGDRWLTDGLRFVN
jgi:Mce-associated membrane protein